MSHTVLKNYLKIQYFMDGNHCFLFANGKPVKKGVMVV